MNGRKQVVIVLLQAGIDVTLHNDRSMTRMFLVYYVSILGSETNVVVVVIAQRRFSYRQLSRLRKSATAAGLSHKSCTVSCVGGGFDS